MYLSSVAQGQTSPRVDPASVKESLDTIHEIAARLLAGRADREAYELTDAANTIETIVRAAWSR